MPNDGEAKRFILQKEVQEAGYEVHSLAVVKVRVDYSVGIQNLAKVLVFNALSESKRSLNILFNLILDFLRQIKLRLLLVRCKFAYDEVGIDFKNLEPQRLALLVYSVLVCPQ